MFSLRQLAKFYFCLHILSQKATKPPSYKIHGGKKSVSVPQSREKHNHTQETQSGPMPSLQHRADQPFQEASATSILRLNTQHKTSTVRILTASLQIATFSWLLSSSLDEARSIKKEWKNEVMVMHYPTDEAAEIFQNCDLLCKASLSSTLQGFTSLLLHIHPPHCTDCPCMS